MPVYNPGSIFRRTSSLSSARRHPVRGHLRPHKGQDYSAPVGTSVPVAFDGIVIENRQMSGFGNVIVVEHKIDGKIVHTLYGHLQSNPEIMKVHIINWWI